MIGSSFFDELYHYSLIYAGTEFEILRYTKNGKESENIPANVNTFLSIEDFWKEITADPNWFTVLNIDRQKSIQSFVLSRKVIETLKRLKKEKELRYGQYEKIYPRYPKNICVSS